MELRRHEHVKVGEHRGNAARQLDARRRRWLRAIGQRETKSHQVDPEVDRQPTDEDVVVGG